MPDALYYWRTCYSIHNCFHLFSCKMQFNRQEEGMSSSIFNGWWCTPYSFPKSYSESSSMILRCPWSNCVFFWTGARFAFPVDGGVFAPDGALQSCAWWLLLPHFMPLPSAFRLCHTSFGTNSPFLFSLPDSPPFNYIRSSRPHFFLWPLLLLYCSFF